jgi:hypothetical protein
VADPARRTFAPLELDVSELSVRAPEEPEPNLPYRAAVGSLMYLAFNTRADMMFVTCSRSPAILPLHRRPLRARPTCHPLPQGHIGLAARHLQGAPGQRRALCKERLGNGELSASVDADWATWDDTSIR